MQRYMILFIITNNLGKNTMILIIDNNYYDIMITFLTSFHKNNIIMTLIKFCLVVSKIFRTFALDFSHISNECQRHNKRKGLDD